MILQMREAMYTPVTSVDGSYSTMMSIGISTTDNSGNLRFDEDNKMQVDQFEGEMLLSIEAFKNYDNKNVEVEALL